MAIHVLLSQTVETQYIEGPRDCQKLFTIMRFSYSEVLSRIIILLITGVKKIIRYTKDFVI